MRPRLPLKLRYLRWRWRTKQRLAPTVGRIAVVLLNWIRRFDRKRMSNLFARLMRMVGPWLREHRIGRANLAAAFPEKSAADIETILAGAWDNLGRLAAEFAQLDRLSVIDLDTRGRADIECDAETIRRFYALRESGRPALVFAAHLANWELPARAAAAWGIDAGILYRPPNIRPVAEAIERVRGKNMGTLIASGPDAPFRMAALLKKGVHVGMLIDQHYYRGVDVRFFDQPCKANPTLARLARHFDCPIHGLRAIRVDTHRFRIELTEPVPAVRDARGQVDVQGTMQAVTDVVERWVREYPDQWLWQHRRWR